jgi:dihydropteroate synthase
MQLTFPNSKTLTLDRPRIVGILNVTPDSFSDGGLHTDVDAAVRHAAAMAAHGADLIDVGGESTRPGAQRVDAAEQLRRVLPVIHRIAGEVGVAMSIDTTSAEVAEAALEAGAAMINDVSAGRGDEAMLEVAAGRGVPIVLMHMRGEPGTMQDEPRYGDVVREVHHFLVERAAAAVAAGVRPSQVVIDPGIGFGKTAEHNLTLLAHLGKFVETGYAVMLGASRKKFLAEFSGGAGPEERVAATAATTAIGVMAGVHLLRVHDVRENRAAADVTFAVKRHLR